MTPLCRKLAFALLAALASFAPPAAAVQDCGQVTVAQLLAGPRHGSMMRVSNPSCGPGGGWICLDPDPQYLTPEKSKRLYALLLSLYLTNRPFQLSVNEGTFATACNGGYPVVEDVRTP
jgi:hypothetical protein